MNAASASERVFGVRAPISVGVVGNGRAMILSCLCLWLYCRLSCVILYRVGNSDSSSKAGFIIPSDREQWLAFSTKSNVRWNCQVSGIISYN